MVGTVSVVAVVAIFLPIGGAPTPSSAEAFPGPASITGVVTKAIQEKQIEEQKSRDSLHGAAPSFAAQPNARRKPATAKKKADGKKPTASAAHDSRPASTSEVRVPASEAAVSSLPSGAAPAGRAALNVAREFGEAFVVYEIDGVEGKVRSGFRQTSTKQLSRALLHRPPRQPAAVKVPKAKVVNVVAGPSKNGVYPVSVSLLRVGATSELRLELEQGVGKKWQVTDVLG